MRAGVHIHRGTRQHAHLAHPVERPGAQAGKAHQQVDDEKGENGHQPQGEQVKRTIALNAAVNGLQAFAKALLHAVAQQEAGNQESQGGADTGREGHQQQAETQAEQRAAGQRHDGSTRQRERGDHDVNGEIGRRHRHRVRRQQVGKPGLAVFQLVEGQVVVQAKGKKRQHEAQQGQHNQELSVHRCYPWGSRRGHPVVV